MNKQVILIVCLTLVFALGMTGVVLAQSNVDVASKIYNQWRWTNATGNGFGPHTTPQGRDNVSFGNFVKSEVEFEVNASVGQYVRTYLRMKTIWDADDNKGPRGANSASWQTYWDANTGWFKLRGFRVDFMPPTDYVDVIQLGTPMGLPFSRWFVADRRYIDRDNTKGIVIKGQFNEQFGWNVGRLWQPEWQTLGWGNPDAVNDFRPEDGTWALNIGGMPSETFSFDFDAFLMQEKEFDPEDIDNPNYDGTTDDDPNGNMSVRSIYNNFGFGLTGKFDMSETATLNLAALMTGQKAHEDLDADEDNIIDDLPWGYGPVPKYAEVMAPAFIFNIKTTDPFDMGLTPSFEVFYIHHNYVALWGSRREHDMLMIDGGIDGMKNVDTFLWGGGQTSVRHDMVDNGLLRLGEDMYESPVGYGGVTLDLNYDLDKVTLDGQFNMITATDNADDKDDPDYDGDGELKMPDRDFAGMVIDLGAKTQVSEFDLGLDVRLGAWADDGNGDADLDDRGVGAMVVELMLARQLSSALHMELRPRIQSVVQVGAIDLGDGNAHQDDEVSDSDFVFSHTWLYNLGGFDFWLRGEHMFRTHSVDYNSGDRDDPEDVDLSYHAFHAAWEVKF